MSKKHLAVCGLECTKCPAYIATLNNDDNLRQEIAAKWKVQFNADVKPCDVNCVGCLGDGVKIPHCQECGPRLCAVSKKVANCSACQEFHDCKTRKNFEKFCGMNMEDNFKNNK
jgi:hypothetical protein